MIDGVRIDPLRQINGDCRAVFHLLRADDPRMPHSWRRFGEVNGG